MNVTFAPWAAAVVKFFRWKCSESVAIYESFSSSTSAAVTKSRGDWFLIIFMSVSQNSHTRLLEFVCHGWVENSAFINKSCEWLKISEKIHKFYESEMMWKSRHRQQKSCRVIAKWANDEDCESIGNWIHFMERRAREKEENWKMRTEKIFWEN